jgi:ferrous iron transport protein A
MEKILRLHTCAPGFKGTVAGIEIDELTPKLIEMGFYEGKEIEVKYKAPFGDPLAIDLGGYLLSLRLDEAKLVLLTPSHDSTNP